MTLRTPFDLSDIQIRDRSRTPDAKRQAIQRKQERDWLNDQRAQAEYLSWSARVALHTATVAAQFSPRGDK